MKKQALSTHWLKPGFEILEDRIAPAVFGTPGVIQINQAIAAPLTASDTVQVEIGSGSYYDSYQLNSTQLAGTMELSFANGVTPVLGQTYTVLTSTKGNLTGNFAAFKGAGFYNGLYLDPVVSGNTLSFVVKELAGVSNLGPLKTLRGNFSFGLDGLDRVVTGTNVSLNFGDNLVQLQNGMASYRLNPLGQFVTDITGDVTVKAPGLTAAGNLSLHIDTTGFNPLDDELRFAGSNITAQLGAAGISFDVTGNFAFEQRPLKTVVVAVSNAAARIGQDNLALNVTNIRGGMVFNPLGYAMDFSGHVALDASAIGVNLDGNLDRLRFNNIAGGVAQTISVPLPGGGSDNVVVQFVDTLLPSLEVLASNVTVKLGPKGAEILTLQADAVYVNKEFAKTLVAVSGASGFVGTDGIALNVSAVRGGLVINPLGYALDFSGNVALESEFVDLRGTVNHLRINNIPGGVDEVISVPLPDGSTDDIVVHFDTFLSSLQVLASNVAIELGPEGAEVLTLQAGGVFISKEIGKTLIAVTGAAGRVGTDALALDVTNVRGGLVMNLIGYALDFGGAVSLQSSQVNLSGTVDHLRYSTILGGVNETMSVPRADGGTDNVVVQFSGALPSVQILASNVALAFGPQGSEVLTLQADGLSIDKNALRTLIGVNNASGQVNAAGLAVLVSNVTGGLVINPLGYALDFSGMFALNAAATIGVDASGTVDRLRVNNIVGGVNETIVMPLAGGGTSTFVVQFDNPLPSVEIVSSQAQLRLGSPGAEFLTLNVQGFALIAGSLETLIAISNASGQVGTGEFTFTLSNFRGGLLFNPVGYALDFGGHFTFDGSRSIGVYLDGTVSSYRINTTGLPVNVSTTVPLPGGGTDTITLNFPSPMPMPQFLVSGEVKLGPASAPILTSNFHGMFVSADNGFAGKLVVDVGANFASGLGVSLGGNLILEFNTTGQDQTYPGDITPPPGTNSTIPGGPPPAGLAPITDSWTPAANAPYFLAYVNQGHIDILNSVRIDGNFLLVASTVGVDVRMDGKIGLAVNGTTLLGFDVNGGLALSPTGVVADVTLAPTTNNLVGLTLTPGFTYQLQMDTTLGSNSYVRVRGTGDLLVGGFTIAGQFDFTRALTYVNIHALGSMDVKAGPTKVFGFGVDGDFQATDQGVAAVVGLALQSNIPNSLGFTLGASFTLEVNSTTSAVPALGLPAGPFFCIIAEGSLTITTVNLTLFAGTFDICYDQGALVVDMNTGVSIWGTTVPVIGRATIFPNGIALDIGLGTVSLYPVPNMLGVSGSATLHIDTTVPEAWVAVPNVTVNMFGLQLTGGLQIGIDTSGFSFTIPSSSPLTLNLAIATFQVTGYLNTDSSFSFTGSVSLNLRDPVTSTGVVGTFSVTFSNSGFSGNATLDFYLLSAYVGSTGLGFGIDTNGSMQLSGELFGVPFDINIGSAGSPPGSPPPPAPTIVLADVSSGVLTLHMGVDAGLRVLQTSDGSENFSVSHVSGSAGNETVTVTAFGTSQDYSGVRSILANNTGIGGDVISVNSGVLADASLQAGSGNDTLTYLGSGTATLRGDAGSDTLTGANGTYTLIGGSGDGTTLNAGSGNAILIGGSGTATLNAGSGTGQFYGGSGNATMVWSVGAGNVTAAQGGAGVNTLIVNDSRAGAAIEIVPDGGSFHISVGARTISGATNIQQLIVNATGGADTVTINESAALAGQLGDIALNLGTHFASDQVVINETDGGATYTLFTANGVINAATTTGVGIAIYQAARGDSLTLDLGNDSAYVLGTLVGTTTTINSSNTIQVGSSTTLGASTLSGIAGNLIVDGGGSAALVLSDQANTAGTNGTLTSSLITGMGLGSSGVTYTGINALAIDQGSGNDTFTIQSTHGNSTTINTGDGADTVNVRTISGATTVAAGQGNDIINVANTSATVNSIAALLAVDGGGQSGDTVNVTDTGDSAANTGTLTSTQLTGLGLAVGMTYTGVAALNINLGSGGNTFNVQSTPASTTTTLKTGAVNDTINVGSSAPGGNGTVNSVAGGLVIDAQGGADTLNVDDTGDGSANTGNLTNQQLTGLGLGVGITYASLETVNVNLGDGSDTFTIQSTHAGTTNLNSNGGDDTINVQTSAGPTNVTTGAGNDTINVANTFSTVNSIAALLTVDGGGQSGGSDTLNVIDRGDTEANSGNLTSSQITGLDLGVGINYTGLEVLNFDLGSGRDVFTIESTHAGTTNLFGNRGADVVNVRTISGLTNISTGDGNDVINVGTTAGQTGRPAGLLSGIGAALTIDGGASNPLATLNVDDTANGTATSGTLTSNQLTGLDLGSPAGITYSNVRILNVGLGQGGVTFNVTSLGAATTINPKGNGTPPGGTGKDTYNISTNGSLAGSSLVVHGDGGNDTFNVTRIDRTTTLYTDAGNATFNVGSQAPTLTGGVVANIGASLTIWGGPNNNNLASTLNVDDTGDTIPATSTLTSTTLTGLGMASGITYYALSALNIYLGGTAAAANTMLLTSTNYHTPTLIVGGPGNDTFNVDAATGANLGNLDAVQGVLTINGNGGTDTLHTSDHGATGFFNYLIDGQGITNNGATVATVPNPTIPPPRTFAGIYYSNLQFVSLDGTDQGNIFTLTPSPAIQFTINGNSPDAGTVIPGAGDYLYLNTTKLAGGTGGRTLHFTPVGSGNGFWSFTDGTQNVYFTSIERFDHVASAAVAADAGKSTIGTVRVYDTMTGQLRFQVTPYGNTFRGGVNGHMADVNGDGVPDLITVSGPGRVTEIKIYDGAPDINGNYQAKLIGDFLPFGPNYTYGASVAAGFFGLGSRNDLVVGGGPGWLPIIKVFTGTSLLGTTPSSSPQPVAGTPFYAFPPTFRGGVRVAAGDLNNDGLSDLVVSSGRGMVTTVNVYLAQGFAGFRRARSFQPFGPNFTYGAYVAVGDFDGDGFRDVIVGAGAGWLPQVRVFSGKTLFTVPVVTPTYTFMPYVNTFRGGVRVTAQPIDGGNPGVVEKTAILMAPGGPAASSFKVRKATYNQSLALIQLFDLAFANTDFLGGTNIG